jgi:UDP-glucose 4-epimerase
VADSLITGKRANLDHIPGVEFLEGDLADMPFAQRAAEGMDYVLHQAAIPSVPRSVKDPITSNRANVDATLNVLVAARDAGVKRLVFAGSSSAYGNTPTLPKHEDMPDSPLSPYALQKVVGEQYLQMFTRSTARDRDHPLLQRVRPRQDPSSPYSGVISVFATALIENVRRRSTATASRPATSPTSPTSSTACCARANAEGASGEVINVATGGRISLNSCIRG